MTDVEIYTKLVEEKLKEMAGDFIEFDGMNCHDVGEEPYSSCAGWDGMERRCSCGNRRVSWVLSDDKTYVYGEAY